MPETTVFDHYEVLRREDGSLYELGRGAMGITYKAFDTNLRCPVALKVINAASIHSEVARQRFVREARSAAQLRHRHVASVFHLGVEGDTYFYAMEFIEGETVESLVRRGGKLQPILALRIAVQVARALNAAQKHQLVHRDIKPSNLMLVREDEELVVKVIDFGLAKSSQGDTTAGDVTISGGGFVGTPHFASPEQLDELDLDVRSDIYSLGVTLWYMLAGEPPFSGTLAHVMSQHLSAPPPMARIGFAPESVRDLLARMLAKKPADRPQTPTELRGQLEASIGTLARSTQSDPESAIVLLPESGRTGGDILRNKGFYAGAFVAGRYELLRDLGENNTGWSFLAEDAHDRSRLRLVVLQADWLGDPAAFAQIEREVAQLQSVEHPNILRVQGIQRSGDSAFLLLEWTEGFALLELLRCRQEIDADEALLLLKQIAAGVDEAAARGLRHIDFSLGQIFVHFPGVEKEVERRLTMPVDRWPQFIVKVNALGITREFSSSDTWAGGQTMVGEAAARDSASPGGRHAMQSLAAVVYELLGGTLSPVMIGALGTQPAPRYVPIASLPEAGNEVLRKALDPKRAYATGAEFCQALGATLAGAFRAQASHSTAAPPAPPRREAPGAALRIPPSPEPAPPGKRRKIPWLGIAAVAGCCIAGMALFLMTRSGPEQPQEQTAAATPLPQTPTPPPAATPAPTAAPTPVSTPMPDPMQAALQAGQNFEASHDWAKAIETYLDFSRDYPGVDTGRVRLDTLLDSLRPMFEKMPASQFTALRPAITDAASQDYPAAMVILANHLRAAAPMDAYGWYCAAAARGNGEAMTQAGLMASNGEGVPKDYAQAVVFFQMGANAGDAAAKTCLAECYLHGTGVKKDERQGLALLQDAVAANDPRAMNLLGACDDQGIGGQKNFAQAFQLFSRAHDLHFPDAAGNLGVLYMNGEGVPRDQAKAVGLFDEGAHAGSPYCMYLLAECLEYGAGIAANQFEAEAWYRKAAGEGNPMALQWCNDHHIPLH
ncbi:MAG TPA: protein kinase [Chthoniobacteraceae bacterium]|jgi:serine/threonine protein kinase/TPR repeat protein|nr:protein kinase [Chthoniobacteraceae bacterium]